MKKILSSLPLRVSILYAVIAGIWIITSDKLIEGIDTSQHLQTYKGWFFVLVTAILLFVLVNRLFGKIVKHNKELTEAQKELKESKKLLSYILDNIPQSIFWKDNKSVYLGSNKAFADSAGLKSPEEIIGKTDNDLPWKKEDIETYIRDDQEVILNKKVIKDIKENLQTAEGKYLQISTTKVPLLDENKNVIGVLGVFDDITDRKIAEEKLKESEIRYRMLFESNPQPMWVYDTLTFQFLDVNDAAVDKYGYTREEFLSMSIKDIRPAEDISALVDYVAKRNEDNISAGTWRHKLKNGKIIDVEIYSHNIDIENQKSRLVLAYDVTERKLAEEKLIKSEKNFRKAVLNAPFPIIIFTEDWEILTISKIWTEITGYSLEEIPTIEVWVEKAYGSKKNEVLQVIRKLDNLEGSIEEGEFEITCKNGTKRIWDFSSSPLGKMADGRKGFISMASDVTERKRVEEVLIESEERHRSTLENMQEGYQIIGYDWRYIYLNNSACKQARQPREELIGSTMMEKFPGIEETDMFGVLKKCMEERVSEIIDNKFTYPDGSVGWFQLSVQPVPEGIFILSLDISQMKKTAMIIKESAVKFRSLFESMNEGVAIHEIIYDSMKVPVNYIITDVNPSFEMQTGIKKENVAGKKATEAYGLTEAPYLTEYANVVLTGKPYVFETFFPPLSKYFKISVTTPKQGSFVTVFQDITSNKLAAEEIKKLNAELEERVKKRTQQLEDANKELEAFTYSVSHDLRSPLRAIDGFSKIVLEDYTNDLDEEAKRLLLVIRNNTKQMDTLITDLLSLSRITRSELKFMRIDMKKMVEDAFSEILQTYDKDKYSISISELPNVCGDPTLIKQVWSNLISNAVKYSAPKENRSIKVNHITDGKTITYYIQDNGVGFNPDYSHKLFGVFQRLHGTSEFEGTGVGLAIVDRIIKRHQGKVWGEGKINEGAAFYFSIPKDKDCYE